jgi:hypothetical protein
MKNNKKDPPKNPPLILPDDEYGRMRQQAYADSLSLYNLGEKAKKEVVKLNPNDPNFEKLRDSLEKKTNHEHNRNRNIWPIGSGNYFPGNDFSRIDKMVMLDIYEKPVQPIEIQKGPQKLKPKSALLPTSDPRVVKSYMKIPDNPNVKQTFGSTSTNPAGENKTRFEGNFNLETGEWNIEEKKPVNRNLTLQQPFEYGGNINTMKQKYILGGALYNTAKAFGANDTIANSLGAVGGIGEAFFNPLSGGVDAAMYGSRLIQNREFGGLTEFEGPKHSEGGISINPSVEVEGGETMNKQFVFSDKVKPKGSKSTYAELSKKIENKYKKRGEDKMANEAKQMELDKLKQLHEADPQIIKGRLKQQKTQMAYGGPAYGQFLDDSYNEALNTGLVEPMMPNQPEIDENGFIVQRSQSRSSVNSIVPKGSFKAPDGNVYALPDGVSNIDKRGGNLNTTPAEYRSAIVPGSPMQVNPQVNPSTMQSNQFNDRIPVTGALMNSIGPVSQLAGTLINGVDDVNFNRVKPEFVNYDPLLQIADRQGANAMATNRMNVANNATSSGQMLSNMVAGNVGINSNLSNQKANIKMQGQNMNNQIANQANATNTGIANEEQIARQQNKAAYRQAIYGALTDIGNIGAGYTRDNAMMAAQNTQNNRTLDMLGSLPYRYNWFMDENGNLKTGVKTQ